VNDVRDDVALPAWLEPVRAAARDLRPEQLSRFVPPPEGGRESAVLILFGEGPGGPDLLLIQRSSTMSSHPGQPAFPGGALDPDDDGVVAAALREAVEETGLDAAGVDVFATLPALWLPPSGFVVTPVLAWWRAPSPVGVVDPGEVESVARVPLEELLDPANRCSVRHPSGFTGPGFAVRGMLVWGFTAGLLSRLLALSGFERPWDAAVMRELEEW
jgi:8-oxo-dGTP pyrophosphatase MutT (NUDIX family)